MILKDKVFCNENFSVIAGGEVCKDVVKLCVGIKNNEDPINVQVVCGRLTMNEMKELRDYIDDILKTYEDNKESEEG